MTRTIYLCSQSQGTAKQLVSCRLSLPGCLLLAGRLVPLLQHLHRRTTMRTSLPAGHHSPGPARQLQQADSLPGPRLDRAVHPWHPLRLCSLKMTAMRTVPSRQWRPLRQLCPHSDE